MGFEDDSYQEREEPVNINYQSSSPIAANQLGQTNNPLFTNPLQSYPGAESIYYSCLNRGED